MKRFNPACTISRIIKLPSLTACFIACSLATAACSSGFENGEALGNVSKKKLKEISGLSASRWADDIFWVHNDGKAKQLFAVDSSGTVLGQLSLKSLEITDLEDIATGPGPNPNLPYIYLADCGDNDETRETIRVIRFAEPDSIDSLKKLTPQFETFHFRYPGGKFDSEALMVDPLTGDVIVVTKGKTTRVHFARQEQLVDGETITLSLLSTLPVVKVSAGDISSNGESIVMRNESHAWLWDRDPSEPLATAFTRRPRPVPVIGPPTEPNGEAIAFQREGKGYFTLSEGVKATIYYFASRDSR